MAGESIWVVIPAYNEQAVLAAVLDELFACNRGFNVVVVDDGSTDATAEIAASAGVHLLRHPVNLGQGAALATGIEYALKAGAEIVVTFDADGQMKPADIEGIVNHLTAGGFDAVLGSRFLSARPENMPAVRKFLLRLAVIFTRVTTGLEITDVHNGFRAFRADAMAKINITQNQMAHASQILSEIARNKLKFCEFPVSIRYTDYSKAKGQSVFNSINIIWELFTGGKK